MLVDDLPGNLSGGDVLSPEPGRPVCGLTGITGEVVRATGKTLAPVSDRLLPGSGETLEGVTDDLGDTVHSAGDGLVGSAAR